MKYLIVLAIVSWLLIPGLAHADLSPKDDAALTDAFETISAGWVESVANSATDILCKMNDDRQPLYTAAEWERWFQKFFNASNHAYVDSLADYLVYPVFYWCNDAARLNLQT